MTRYVNRWTALLAWAALTGIVWASFVPRGLSVGTFILLALSGPIVLVTLTGLWGALRPSPSVGQARVGTHAAEAPASVRK